MKYVTILSLAAVVGFFLLPSCSAVKWAVPAMAGSEMDEESWALRYVPGLKALSDFIPPPTEARQQWDERYRNKNCSWASSGDTTP